jgi:hypothetical protein
MVTDFGGIGTFFVQIQLTGSSMLALMYYEEVKVWSLYCLLRHIKYNLGDLNKILKTLGCLWSCVSQGLIPLQIHYILVFGEPCLRGTLWAT